MKSFKAILGILFFLLVASITVFALLSYRINEEIIRMSSMVAHTQDVIIAAEKVSSNYKDARLSVNKIIINHDTSFIAKYEKSLEQSLSGLNDLQVLAPESHNHQGSIDSLSAALHAFRNVSDSLIAMVITRAPVSAIRDMYAKTGSLKDSIASKIDRVKSIENALLLDRETAKQANVSEFRQTFIFLLSGTGLLLLSTFAVTRYHFNRRLETEKELLKSNTLFEKIFYQSPIAIVISDAETGVILNCNEVFARLINYDVSQIIGRTGANLGVFQDQEKRNEIVAGARQEGLTRQMEVFIKPRDRVPVYVSVQAHAISLYDRECLLTAILDLTMSKRAEGEIRKALDAEREVNKLKSSFITLASHEFKTPLTTILSSAFLLEKYSYGEHHDKAVKHLAKIKTSVNILVSILDEFLSLSKIEEGRIHAYPERIDLPTYLSALCENLKPLTKPGQIIQYLHSGEQEVNADPVLLSNILSNLISNSIKYSEENSPIQVLSAVNSKVHVTVKDSGIGIPEEDQPKLFQRFYRASNAGSVPGSGLGLHITKQYVGMLNGTIDLKSQVGMGTEVTVTFGQDKKPEGKTL